MPVTITVRLNGTHSKIGFIAAEAPRKMADEAGITLPSPTTQS
jgi:hypothetical protein